MTIGGAGATALPLPWHPRAAAPFAAKTSSHRLTRECHAWNWWASARGPHTRHCARLTAEIKLVSRPFLLPPPGLDEFLDSVTNFPTQLEGVEGEMYTFGWFSNHYKNAGFEHVEQKHMKHNGV